MLFFELFPAFMALVCIVAGIALVKMNLDAKREAAAEADTARDRRLKNPDVDTAAVIGFLAVVLVAPAASAQTRLAAVPRIERGDARAVAVSAALEATARRVGPAVVEIFTTSYRPTHGLVAHGGDLVTTERASGSGVIVDDEGYIVTNAHVVRGAHRVRVDIARPTNGTSILGARSRSVTGEIVGFDRETDIAVIKIDGAQLPSLAFADSDALETGQLVLAVGSPMGFNNSVSLGIVSAVARQLEPESPMIYVQTDASINHGSSGGPLVDLDGHVVGINTLIISQAGGDEGLGFAAPSNIVRTVYEQIRKYGRVRRGEIGIRAQTITPALAGGLGLPRDHGVVIADVIPGGPAARAGLAPGDLVLTLDDKPMENGRQLHVGLYRRFVGDVVSFDVLREGRPLTFAVTMTERRELASLEGVGDPREHLVQRLGILAVTMDDRVAAAIPALRVGVGVVVVSTLEGALDSREGGLAAGDIVFAINGVPVRTLGEFRDRVNAFTTGDSVVLQLEREGTFRYLAFTLE